MVYVPPKYPSEIPTLADLPNRQDDVDWLYAARYNELKKELRAALIELGTLPKGAYADVKARLDAAAIGDKISEGDSSVEVIDTDGDGHVDIKTENALCGKFHSDGILDLAKQPGCRAYRATSNQTIPDSTMTKVEFNGEDYDKQNEFDPVTNYRFTAKKAGYYLVTVDLRWLSAVDECKLIANVYKNAAAVGSNIKRASGTEEQTTFYTLVLSLAANDYVEIHVWQTAGAEKDIRYGIARTSLSIAKVA